MTPLCLMCVKLNIKYDITKLDNNHNTYYYIKLVIFIPLSLHRHELSTTENYLPQHSANGDV